MNRARLFPTKSRYQVAVCLAKLAQMARRASARAEMAYVCDDDEPGRLLSNIALLAYSRLQSLIVPVIFEPRASVYRWNDRQIGSTTQHAITQIRGWRKRHPDLLNTITKEQKSNGS